MEYQFKVGQRVRLTKTINRPKPYEGTVNGISSPQNTILKAGEHRAKTVDVRLDGASSVTTWPIKFWRVIL